MTGFYGKTITTTPGVERPEQKAGTVRVTCQDGANLLMLIVTDDMGCETYVYLGYSQAANLMVALGGAASEM